MLARFGTALDICFDRFRCGIKIDREHIRRNFRCTQKHSIGENQKIIAHKAGDPAHGNAIQHTKGMIRHKDQRTLARDLCQLRLVELDRHAHSIKTSAKPVFTRLHACAVFEIQQLDGSRACQLFENADQHSLHQRRVGINIGERCLIHGRAFNRLM